LNIDIMCEGHENIIDPAKKVSKFLRGYIQLNKQLNKIIENPHNPEILFELTLLTYELEFYENALDFCNYLLEIYPDNNDALKLIPEIKKHNPIEINYIKGLLTQATK
ncbi:MAG: hypothetical protein HWN81_09090, partial [Candidatus Lokiarchaeota archaeon]|nr:hypothetical protein [Candidatus Lokiarchaeota archaeon]